MDWHRKLNPVTVDADLEAAVTLAVNELRPGRVQADVVVGLAAQRVRVNPQATDQWVARFPEGKMRNDAIVSVAPIWWLTDAAQASAWRSALDALPHS